MAEENSTSTESTETTTTEQSVETQQVETQTTEQVDTTASTGKVTDSLAIEAETVREKTESEQPTIDDIVEEALSGELSEETQKLIDDNGLGKHIDMLVAGNKAIQEKNNLEIFTLVGGEKSYTELQEWGRSTMSEEQQKSFNSALFSGDMNLAKLAVQGLQAQYVAANGKAPERVIESGGGINTADKPFGDVNDYIRETMNRKYKLDPEFKASVEARRGKSGF